MPIPNAVLTPQRLGEIQRSITSEPAPHWLAELAVELQSADYMLAMLMYEQNPKIWTPPNPPVQPANYDSNAAIELGPVLYCLEHPLPTSLLNKLSPTVGKIVAALWWVLGQAFVLNGIQTQIQPVDFATLLQVVETGALIADDGTAVGRQPYEQLDEGWLWAVVNYAAYWLRDYILSKTHIPKEFWPWTPAPFNSLNASVITLPSTKPQVKLAIFGDWGSGQLVPVSLLNQILACQPDYLIHLGDVYYAGTSELDVLGFGEEQRNLLDVLHAAQVPLHTCFTLNSNHEMYGGAQGYYGALTDQLFSLQNGSSYFALQYGGWTIFALDSAYYATKMFMYGAIPPAPNPQAAWVQATMKKLNISPQKVILMTHHNGLTHGWDGTAIGPTPLWADANRALGGNPAYWYWGHVHNGIVYTQQASPGTLARCIGHGCIPFGNAENLASFMPQYIQYYSHTASPKPPLVLNGFAMLTISQNGSITEQFYEAGNTTPLLTLP